MKQILQSKLIVRVIIEVEGKTVESKAEKSIRDIIVDPQGVHADDVLNAMRFFCAQIIAELEATDAA